LLKAVLVDIVVSTSRPVPAREIDAEAAAASFRGRHLDSTVEGVHQSLGAIETEARTRDLGDTRGIVGGAVDGRVT